MSRKSFSTLDRLRLAAGIQITQNQDRDYSTNLVSSEQRLDEAAGLGPKGAIQHLWVVTKAGPTSALHDVINLTDTKGLINQILGMVAKNDSVVRTYIDSQNLTLFPENAKAAAVAEAKSRIAAAQGSADQEEVTEMEYGDDTGDRHDDIDVDVEDKPSTQKMRDAGKEEDGYCDMCKKDPCECDEKDEAGKEDINSDIGSMVEGKTKDTEVRQLTSAIKRHEKKGDVAVRKAQKWMKKTGRGPQDAAKEFDLFPGDIKKLKASLNEASKDESQTAPGKTGVNAQNPVEKLYKKTYTDKPGEPLTNVGDEGEWTANGSSLYPEDAKRQTDSEEYDETITIPANIKSELKARIAELKSSAEKERNHDFDLALLHGRSYNWMQKIFDHLDGTMEGMKWAQIHYLEAMGPIKQLMPDDVRTWIARGGIAPSLKQYYTIVKDSRND